MPAIGEFLCPECGGTAIVCFTTVDPERINVLPGRHSAPGPRADTGHPLQICAVVELVCQGPPDPDAPDEDPRWQHAGQTVADLLATGYRPIGLN